MSKNFKSMLIRSEHNPLFRPEDFPYGAAEQVFNPGQVMTPDGRTILLLSVFVLKVPVAGSLAALGLVSLIYIITNLSLGLLISTMAQQQVIALMFSGLLLMVPAIVLSGMVFSVERMPPLLQAISCIVPPRWYISAVRKLMIQGLPLIYAWKETVILISMAVVLIAASLKLLNNRLE